MLSFILSLLLILNLSSTLNQAVYLDKIAEIKPDESSRVFPYSLGPKLTSRSALAFDAETGAVLFEKDADLVLPIASITKLMTALVFLENNTKKWNETVRVELGDLVEETNIENDIEPAGLAIKPGNILTIKDIFYGGLIKSANNAMKILARLVENGELSAQAGLPEAGVDKKTFVDLMNEKAASLKMINTHFVEPTGLDSDNRSTVRDLAKLIVASLEKEEIKQALNTNFYNVLIGESNGVKTYQRIYNTNKLLNTFIDLVGAKTGYLRESGYCFAGLSDYHGRRTVVVILGAVSDKDRFQEAKSLIWWSANRQKEEGGEDSFDQSQ